MAVVIDSPRLNAVSASVVTLFYRAFNSYPKWSRPFVRTLPGKGRSTLLPFISDPLPVTQWSGNNIDRPAGTIGIGTQEILHPRWVKTVGINRDELEDDVTGALYLGAESSGEKFAALPEFQLSQVLITNATCADGLPLFSHNHPIDPVAGAASGTFDNDLVLGPPTPDNVGVVSALMSAIKRPDGYPLNPNPTSLLGPPALRQQMRKTAFNDVILGAPAVAASPSPRRAS